MTVAMKNSSTSKRRVAGILMRCTDFAAARSGAVAMIFALSLIPLLIAAGLAIDMGRAYIVKQRLTATTDAAGLAIGTAIGTGRSEAQLQTVFDNFIAANFPSGELGTITSTNFTYDGEIITVAAQVEVEMTFMKIIRIDSLTVGATSQITRQEDTIEVVLVLDNTGSMNFGGRIFDLKDAANSLVDILFGTGSTSTQVKVALVPFAATVNIGTDNTSYMSSTQSWSGCVLALDEPDDTADESTGTWDPYSQFLFGCPRAITPLTNVKSTLTSAINAMNASGFTHVNYGAIWGLRVISAAEPFTEGVSYGTPDATKAVIILTDGANTSFSASAYQNYPSLPSASQLDDKLETVCTAMKREDIVVYTITFALNDPATQSLFENCATDDSKYFNSPSGAELTRVFRVIASQLKRLHVSS